ncbi:hypothetical protein K458DRAFT_40266 [Lentithecium fluviatile CBS 122367]|uniref:Uncharacterized protein n=1 Tax=Lentithecium fluviatile CBS 122367 TaxID=1168545 RepID=A0A6G1IZW4_9PLEO|nr:hypothetical protein K458DRAFT_40266 [Lentithecium fluviatile CBS 122367]
MAYIRTFSVLCKEFAHRMMCVARSKSIYFAPKRRPSQRRPIESSGKPWAKPSPRHRSNHASAEPYPRVSVVPVNFKSPFAPPTLTPCTTDANSRIAAFRASAGLRHCTSHRPWYAISSVGSQSRRQSEARGGCMDPGLQWRLTMPVVILL